MTQGIFINGQRPKSKKEVRELVNKAYESREVEESETLDQVWVEATSVFGNEFDGPLSELPTEQTITFVGPDPYTKRTFYGQIKFNPKRERWIVS